MYHELLNTWTFLFIQFRKRQNRFKSVLDSGQGIGLAFIPNSSSPVPFNASLDQVNLPCHRRTRPELLGSEVLYILLLLNS